MSELSWQCANQCRCARCDEAYRGPDCALQRLSSRVALDLHDGVAQTLTLALLGMDDSGPDGRPVSNSDATECRGSIVQALAQIRMIIEDLHPSLQGDAGPAARIEAAVAAFEIDTGVEVTRELDPGDLVGLGRVTEITTFRVIQECLNNIRRHAMASRVTLSVARSSDRLHVVVSDDGGGLVSPVASHASTSHHGMGLAGMRERVEFLSGTLHLASDGLHGTTVDFTIPLAEDYARG